MDAKNIATAMVEREPKHEIIGKRLIELQASIGKLDAFLCKVRGNDESEKLKEGSPSNLCLTPPCLADFLETTPVALEKSIGWLDEICEGLEQSIF